MKKRRGYKLSYDLCKKVALSYNTKVDLQKGDGSVYQKIRTSKWDELFSHMISVQKPTGYWTKERCQKEALKYTRRVDFQKGSVSAQNAAARAGWMDEICQHMGKSHAEKQYTKEEILESARKYSNQRDWYNTEPSVFRCASGYNKKCTSDDDKKFWLS